MGINSEEKTINEDGQEKRAFIVSFTNGALEQLEELRQFFKLTENIDVIKAGISIVQKSKEQGEKKADETKPSPEQ
jgi:hypothetical protein